MIPKIEHIGQSSSASWPKRIRRWLDELFASQYDQLLERELLQLRLERDRLFADLKANQEKLIEVLATVKGIPLRQPIQAAEKTSSAIPTTSWQKIQAEAIAENARAEAEDAEKQKAAVKAKEN
jgi:hypothetical protein